MSDSRGLSAAALAGGVAVAVAAVLATLLYSATGGDWRVALDLIQGRAARAAGAAGRLHGAQGHIHGHGGPSFADADAWAASFSGPERDVFMQPERVVAEVIVPLVAAAAAREAARRVVIVDVGAGTGYFALRIARACPDALLVAADTEPGMRAFVERAAAADAVIARTRNLETAAASGTECGLPAGVRADVALFAAVYHHVDDRVAYLRRLREQSLARDARLVILDYAPGPLPANFAHMPRPPPDMMLRRSDVVAEAEAAGFVLDAAPSLLDGAALYILVFRPVII
jgi:SAM-dependent methyltransferase